MYKTILRNRSLGILGIAESVSGVGNWITMLAVFTLVVFQGGGTVVQSTAVFLTGLLPTLIFSPVAGWLCDHFDRKRLMIASELLSGLIVAGIIVTDRLALIYGLLVLQAISTSIMMPARQASVPDLVARQDLSRANAFLQQLAGIIKIGAPMLAGALLAVVDPHQAIILDVISYGLSAAILSRLPSLPPPEKPATTATAQAQAGTATGQARGLQAALGSVSRALQPSLTTLRGSWHLRFLFGLTFLVVIVIIGFDVLSSIFIRDVLQGDEGLYGLLIGIVGLGTVGSTALLMARKRDTGQWRDVVLGLALLATLPAAVAAAAWLGRPGLGRLVVGLSCLIGGVGNGLINVQAATLLQLLSPPDLLGRLGGLYQSTLVSGQLAGMLLVPILVPSVLSIGLYFLLSAVVMAALILYASLALRRSRPGQAEAETLPRVMDDARRGAEQGA